MPSTVNIGTLEGLLRWKADDAELNKSLAEVAKKADVSKNQVKQYNRELNAITSSYDRVAASLDPVIANTQKYERAERATTAALKAGIITQEQHNRTLSQARDKYLSSSASTLTWREEIQRLTNVITPLSPRVSSLALTVQDLSGALRGLTSTAQASAAGSSAAAAGAGAATSSFATWGAVLAPLLPLIGALAASLGSLYAAFKVFDFLKVAVSEGLKTQQVIEKLNMSLRANGSYAELSANQLVTLAESYELLTGKSKEEIIAAETILSRFDSLNRQTFPEALRVVLAYSKAMGITAEESAKKLAPALDGNTRSLNTLKDVGITFTSSQRKMLTAMVETGDKAGYQAKLLEILREKVGDVSDEDENLIRQMNRMGIVFNDFQESIANQVIPAIEDVVNEIVISLGGWDALKKKVNEVGGAIGNFIRTALYGLAIAFHELGAVIDAFVAGVAPKLAAVFKAHALIFSSTTALRASIELEKAGKRAVSSALDHGEAVERLRKGLLDHRVALEGDTQSYKAHGSAVDDIIAKNSQLKSQVEELDQIFQEHSLTLDRIYDLRMLAASGAGELLDISTRIAEEEKINQKHKDRVELLKLQAKWGEEIGKSLFGQQKYLQKLEIKAKIELELATKLAPIDLTATIKKQFSEMSRVSTESLDKIIDNETQNRAEFQKTFDEYDSLIAQTAAHWKENLLSMKEVADREASNIEEAVRRGLLSVSEGERAIAEIRSQQYSQQLDQWTSVLSMLGDAFGGFFQNLARIAQSVQSVNSTAQSLGGWSSVAGAFGGTIAAFVMLYQYADELITKHKGEKYGTRSDYNIMGGIDQFGFTSQASKELGHQINEILQSLEDSLRISAQDLASLEIRISNDGKQTQAWVKGVWIGTFADTNTAIREALLVAMQDSDSKLRGLSDLMVAGLSDWTSPDMEGLFKFLTQLRTISDLDLSPSVISLQQSFLEINRMREALNRLDQSSQVVIDAHNSLTAAQNRLYDQTINSMLGIDTSAADAIRSLAGFQKGIGDVAGSFEAGIEATIKSIQDQITKLDKEAARAGALGEPSGGGARPGEGRGNNDAGNPIARLFSDTIDAVETERERLAKELDKWTKKLGEVPKALSDQQIDLGIFTAIEDDLRKTGKHSALIAEMEKARVKAKYDEFKLQLIAFGAWERWAAVWQDLYNQAMADAGRGGFGGRGTGVGNTDRDQVRDFIKDKRFELSLVGLIAYQKALKELDNQYDDLIKQAGKDKKLKEDLIKLKEEELRLLAKETGLSIADKFREFLGLVTPFDKVRKTAADLIKEIRDSPFGDARKLAMIGRVMADLERQLDHMSKEMGANLFGSMLSDMAKFGATEEQMAEARKMQAILEHEIRLANFALTIAQLEAEGRLAPEIINKFKEMFAFLQGVDPTKWIGGGLPPTGPEPGGAFNTYSSIADQSNEIYDILKSVQDTIAEWNRSSMSEVLSRAYELSDSFAELMKDVNKIKSFGPSWDYTIQAQQAYDKLVRKFIDDTLGEFEVKGSELEQQLKSIGSKFSDINAALLHLGASQADLQRAEEARLNAIHQALSGYFDSWKQFREGQAFDSLSLLSGEEQFKLAQKQFRDMFSGIQGGDLSRLEDVLPLAEKYRDLLHSFTGGEGVRFGTKEINDALLKIEELVPGFADQLANSDPDLGSSSNPMHVETGAMMEAINQGTAAVNAGNNLALIEMRRSVQLMESQDNRLARIEDILDNPLNVRTVA